MATAEVAPVTGPIVENDTTKEMEAPPAPAAEPKTVQKGETGEQADVSNVDGSVEAPPVEVEPKEVAITEEVVAEEAKVDTQEKPVEEDVKEAAEPDVEETKETTVETVTGAPPAVASEDEPKTEGAEVKPSEVAEEVTTVTPPEKTDDA